MKTSAPVVVETMPVGHKMRIDTTISTVNNLETQIAVCSYTGIAMSIQIPSIPGVALSYTSPLADYKNVEGIIKQGTSYLKRLEMQVLAGLWLTAYKHYELLASSQHGNSSIQNAMLRTCTKDILIESLILSNSLNVRYARRSPQFFLDYDAHKDSKNITGALQSFTKNLANIIFPPADEKPVREIEESDKVTVFGTPVFLQTASKKTKASKVTTAEELREERLKVARKEAKIYLAEIEEGMLLPIGFIKLLKDATSKDNIVALGDTIRKKIVLKLKERDVPATIALAKVIEDCAPKFAQDLFVEDVMEVSKEQEQEVVSTTRKESLKEKLARLAAAKNTSNNSSAKQDSPLENIINIDSAAVEAKVNVLQGEDF